MFDSSPPTLAASGMVSGAPGKVPVFQWIDWSTSWKAGMAGERVTEKETVLTGPSTYEWLTVVVVAY